MPQGQEWENLNNRRCQARCIYPTSYTPPHWMNPDRRVQVYMHRKRGRPAPEGQFPLPALRARALGSWDSTGDPRPKGAKPVPPVARRVPPDCLPVKPRFGTKGNDLITKLLLN